MPLLAHDCKHFLSVKLCNSSIEYLGAICNDVFAGAAGKKVCEHVQVSLLTIEESIFEVCHEELCYCISVNPHTCREVI